MDSGESALALTDSELFVLSNVDPLRGSPLLDLFRRGIPVWAVGYPSTNRLASKGLVSIDRSRGVPWVQLTDSGREALRPSQRLFSLYAREESQVPGGDLEKALNAAAGKNDVAMAAWLLDAGASPNGAHPRFRTPLVTAAVYGNAEVARLLVERGADVNLKDKDGWGPLMHAACPGPQPGRRDDRPVEEGGQPELTVDVGDDRLAL